MTFTQRATDIAIALEELERELYEAKTSHAVKRAVTICTQQAIVLAGRLAIADRNCRHAECGGSCHATTEVPTIVCTTCSSCFSATQDRWVRQSITPDDRVLDWYRCPQNSCNRENPWPPAES